MKNILVALEFDNKAEVLLEKARELADKFDAHVWIVHVAAPHPDFIGYEVGPQYIRNARAETLRDEHRTLQGFAQSLNDKGIKSTSLLIQGATVETIMEECEKLEADLLMIGFNAHSALYKMFIGGTTASVIENSTIPILIVP